MLQIDLATILFEILNFILLSFLLYRFLFKPVLARVRQRAAEKADLLAALTAQKQTLAAEEAELKQRLASLDDERELLLAETRQAARDEKAEILAAARSEADSLRRQAAAERERWHAEAVQQFEEELVDTIFQVSQQLLTRLTPEAVHDSLDQGLIAELGEMGRENMRRVLDIRRSLAGRTPTILIETARPLDGMQQRELLRTCAAIVDQEVELDFDLTPELIAGLRIRLGDVIIEHSLTGEVDQLRDGIVDALQAQILPAEEEAPDAAEEFSHATHV